MKTILRTAAFCLLFLVPIFGFSQNSPPSTALVQVNCPACIGQKTTVSTLNMIRYGVEKLVESRMIPRAAVR